MTNSTSRSVFSFATASSRYFNPFIATSALAVVTIIPDFRSTPGTGANSSGSTPTGTTCIRFGSTLWSAVISTFDDSETVITRFMRFATLVCILVKAYQRLFENDSKRVLECSISKRLSTVIGW